MKCDWCGGSMLPIGRNSWMPDVDEIVLHCDSCHHERARYVKRGTKVEFAEFDMFGAYGTRDA